MGELAKITHNGTDITVSMIKWGVLRRTALSLMMKCGQRAPTRFVPKYETAVVKGSFFTSKPIYVFYYPNRQVAYKKWSELTANLKSGGLYGQEMQALFRNMKRDEQGYVANLPPLEELLGLKT
jgi:hypothetical protein